jgi:hypothetical protein
MTNFAIAIRSQCCGPYLCLSAFLSLFPVFSSTYSKRKFSNWSTIKSFELRINGFCVNNWQGPINGNARDFLYRFCTADSAFGEKAFFALSAFWRINNLHALNTPAQFDPD